jgi:uncharacterized Zn finger protein
MAHQKKNTPASRYWGFDNSDPIPTKNGIKAVSQRGRFAKSWWAGRWEQALNRWIDSSRLARGKTYARRGQVIDLDIQVGLVLARVQGTRPSPYRVRIEVNTLSEAEWERAVNAMSEQAMYAAQLLNGEMPHEIDTVFQSVGVSLFPHSEGDLVADCSCPDWSRPCKHIAAVYLLVGEYLDADPFQIFVMRGRTKEQIMSALRERRADRAKGPMLSDGTAQPDDAHTAPEAPLDQRLGDFWELDPRLRELSIHVQPPEVELQALKVLGEPSFAEDEQLEARLSEIYRIVSRQALDVAYSEYEQSTTDPAETDSAA